MNKKIIGKAILESKDEHYWTSFIKIMEEFFPDTRIAHFGTTIDELVHIDPIVEQSVSIRPATLGGFKIGVEDVGKTIRRRVFFKNGVMDSEDLRRKVNELLEIGKKAQPIKKEIANKVNAHIEYMRQLWDDLGVYTDDSNITLSRGVNDTHFTLTTKFSIESEQELRRIYAEIAKLQESLESKEK